MVGLSSWLTWLHRLGVVPEKVASSHLTIFWGYQPKAEEVKCIYTYTCRCLSKRKRRTLNRVAFVASRRTHLSVSKALGSLSKTLSTKKCSCVLCYGEVLQKEQQAPKQLTVCWPFLLSCSQALSDRSHTSLQSVALEAAASSSWVAAGQVAGSAVGMKTEAEGDSQ